MMDASHPRIEETGPGSYLITPAGFGWNLIHELLEGPWERWQTLVWLEGPVLVHPEEVQGKVSEAARIAHALLSHTPRGRARVVHKGRPEAPGIPLREDIFVRRKTAFFYLHYPGGRAMVSLFDLESHGADAGLEEDPVGSPALFLGLPRGLLEELLESPIPGYTLGRFLEEILHLRTTPRKEEDALKALGQIFEGYLPRFAPWLGDAEDRVRTEMRRFLLSRWLSLL